MFDTRVVVRVEECVGDLFVHVSRIFICTCPVHLALPIINKIKLTKSKFFVFSPNQVYPST